MFCKYANIICDYRVSLIDLPAECPSCTHYKDPIGRIMEQYDLAQLMTFLPAIIIKDKKSIFRHDEIFDLKIVKKSADQWLVTYTNTKDHKLLYFSSNADFKKCIAGMVMLLIENKFI